MRPTMKWTIAFQILATVVLWGCDPSAGTDPRAAPGCELGAYRCDGEVLQICQINAAVRRKTWWDVQDCVQYGREIGTALTCVEQVAKATAECAESSEDAGIAVDGGDAGSATACSLGAWRCHDGVAQACEHNAERRGTAWWDVWDCDEEARELGQAMACVEGDAGDSASCEYLQRDAGIRVVVDPWE